MNKICTSLEQSKKLVELGIDINTADMHYYKNSFGDYIEGLYNSSDLKEGCELKGIEYIPCWSLAALLDILQKTAHFIDEDANVTLSSYKTVEWHLGINNSDLEFTTKTNPVDVCYEMIIKLKERKLL